MTQEPPAEQPESTSGMSRRSVMKTGAAAGLVGTTLPSASSSENGRGTDDAVGLDLAGRLVVGENGYDTIEAAWDDALDGDTVYVHSSYDAASAGEKFPIVIDHREKEVALMGGHPSGSAINAEHVPEANILEVHGAANTDLRNTPLVQNLKLVGGNVGLRVVGAPKAVFAHLKLFKTESHGVHITTTDDDERNTHETRWYDCEAWSCGGSGFRMDAAAGPHGTTFLRCNSTWNGGNGTEPGVALCGASSVWHGGTIQRNSGHGLDVRSGSAQVVRDTYFEGNGMHADHPVQIHANGTIGLTIDSCYFLGRMLSASNVMPGESPHDHVKRAVTLYNTDTTTLQNCAHWYHDEGLVAVKGSDATDNDLNEHSHHSIRQTDATVVDDAGTRTRSNGTVRERDMRELEGRRTGDQGIHDGSGATPWGPVMWTGEGWLSLVTGELLEPQTHSRP